MAQGQSYTVLSGQSRCSTMLIVFLIIDDVNSFLPALGYTWRAHHFHGIPPKHLLAS